MKRHPQSTIRAAFTLVELMVAMALIILIMVILSTAFAVSMEAFRDLKAIGDMQEQLRSTSTLLRRDFAAPHFENEAGDSPRLNALPTFTAWDGTKKGFFYIRQDSPLLTTSATYEGMDADGIPSWRATDQEFGMTVKLPAKALSDTFSGSTTPPVIASLGGNNLLDFASNPQQVVSPWAEVYYFLRPTSVRTNEANGGTFQLYTLYRRQRVLSQNTVVLPNATPGPPTPVQFNPDVINSSSLGLAQLPLPAMPVQPPQFMAVGPELLNQFVSPPPAPGVFIPTNRLGGWHEPMRAGYPSPPPHTGPGPAPAAFDWRPYPISGANDQANYGTDVVLNNVVSMRVQFLNAATGLFEDLPASLGGTGGAYPRVYDTARPAPVGGKPAIRAIRIQLRIYNTNTGHTRQASIVQDL